MFSFQCSVIAKSPRERDNTNTQNPQISAFFRVIPRPSFPAEPDVSAQFSVFSDRKIPSGARQHQHTKPSNFRVFPRHSAAIVSPPSRQTLGRARLLPSRTSVLSFQCSVIAKSPREGDNTNTQNPQISASFRVIPRPSFPADPQTLGSARLPPSRQTLGRARLPPSRTSVFSFQCSVIAKSPRERDNTNTQNPQISAFFRVIPRPSFPAEPQD